MLWAHTLLSLPCIYCIASSAYGLVYLSDDSSVSWYPFPSHTMVKRCATYGSLSLLLSLVPGHIISPTWLGVIKILLLLSKCLYTAPTFGIVSIQTFANNVLGKTS